MRPSNEIAKEMLDALIKGDEAGVLVHIDPNVELIEPVSLPYQGGIGLDAFKKCVFGEILARTIPEIKRCEIIGSGDKVANSFDVLFKSRKTSKTIQMSYVELYTFRNEKIVKVDVYPQDTKLLREFFDAN